jgi:hypothetical protein
MKHLPLAIRLHCNAPKNLSIVGRTVWGMLESSRTESRIGLLSFGQRPVAVPTSVDSRLVIDAAGPEQAKALSVKYLIACPTMGSRRICTGEHGLYSLRYWRDAVNPFWPTKYPKLIGTALKGCSLLSAWGAIQ